MHNNLLQNTIKNILYMGGEVLMKHFGKISNVTVKENPSSVVSKADLESEKVIINIITENFPEHNIISEERGFINKRSSYIWIIDPLDGTSNFIAGLPWFGILVTVMKDHIPFAAGIFLPFDDQLYYAEKGKPSRLNGQIIKTCESKELKNVLVAYSLDYSADYNKTIEETRIIGKLVHNVRNIRSTNCLLDLCYTADGRFGAAINQHEKIWDIAAPWLIIKEAGGVITDIDGNEVNFTITEKDYNKDFSIVAANPEIHYKIMNLIKGCFIHIKH